MKKLYATPTLKVVEFKTETGFAASAFSPRTLGNDLVEFEMIFDATEGPRNDQYIFDETNFWN